MLPKSEHQLPKVESLLPKVESLIPKVKGLPEFKSMMAQVGPKIDEQENQDNKDTIKSPSTGDSSPKSHP